ncbi:MAG: CD1845 family protein [Butyricicoccus sp.]
MAGGCVSQISPYGLPMATAWLTGKIGGLNYALRDFLAS